MAKAQAGGFVFAIKDPRLQPGKDIVFVGNGQKPWESVRRHLEGSSNLEVFRWSRELSKDYPEGLEIVGRAVCDAWLGEDVKVPDLPGDGRTRIEWVILDVEENDDALSGAKLEASRLAGTRKSHWIHKLLSEGHPLLNRRVGRPSRVRTVESE